MEAKFPWNGSELLSREYSRDNYRIIRTGSRTGRAIVFFSSNGIYFPNEEAVYIEAIVTNDRYEWEHIAKNRMIRRYYELLVFVRDIYKQWYVTGINSRYDTADKTSDFLMELTRGMEVTTCGGSAGGYAAVLFAHLLGAEKFFTMSGQFSILHQLNNPLVGKYYSDTSRNKYYNIATFAGGIISGRPKVNRIKHKTN